MAVTFGSSQDLNCGSAAVLDDLNPFTWMFWVRPASLVDLRNICQKRVSSVGKVFDLSGTGGNLRFLVDRASTDLIYTTTDTPLATTGKWYLVVAVFDSGAGTGNRVRFYVGDLSTVPTLRAVSAQEGSGAIQSDASANIRIGNSTAGSDAFPGDIACGMIVNRALSEGEIRSLWRRMRKVSGTVGLWILDHATGIIPDLSGNGNNGSFTGSPTYAPHVPLGLPVPYRTHYPKRVIGGASPQSGTPASAVLTVSAQAPTGSPGAASDTPATGTVQLLAQAPTASAGASAGMPASAILSPIAEAPTASPGAAAAASDPAVVQLASPAPTGTPGAATGGPTPAITQLLPQTPTGSSGSQNGTPAEAVAQLLASLTDGAPGPVAAVPVAGQVLVVSQAPTATAGPSAGSPVSGALQFIAGLPTSTAGPASGTPTPAVVTIVVPAPTGIAGSLEANPRFTIAAMRRIRTLRPLRQRVLAARPRIRTILVTIMAKLPAFDDKRTYEEDVFAFDLVNQLAAGETLSAPAWAATVSPDSPVADPSPGNLISGSASISGAKTLQMLKAGVSGCLYLVTARTDTSTGRKLEQAALLRVVDDAT